MTALKNYLPSLYKGVLPDSLLGLKVQETLATCDRCIMVKPREKIWYKNHLKCCTFFPFMPNYLVGAILKNKSLVSQVAYEKIQLMLREKLHILPLGIVPPLEHQVEFNRREENEFGQREDWLCPYFDVQNNNCGIWRYRGGVCSTFYCHSSYGEKGSEFWEGLNNYLNYAEMALLEEALIRLDFSPREISEQLRYINVKEVDSSLSVVSLRKLWKDYIQDPESFYIKCYDVVKDLSPTELKEALGEMGEAQLKQVIKLFKQMDKNK